MASRGVCTSKLLQGPEDAAPAERPHGMLQAWHAVNFQLTVERPLEKDTNAILSASMYNK